MTVTIAGQTYDDVVNIDAADESSSDLGSATITLLDEASARDQINPGDDVTISRTERDWNGYVTGISSASEGVDIECIVTRLELKHTDLHQVFYNITSSKAVELSVTKQAQPLAKTQVHVGDDLTEWSSNAPVYQLYEGTRAGLYNWGTDLLALGARQGYTKTLTATYHDVTADAIEDGIFELLTRILVPNRGAAWDVEIELTTPSGETYVWAPDVGDAGFEALVLAAEDATPDDGQVSETGTLQYRFEPRARLADNACIFIDNGHTKPFRRRDRPTGLSTSGVQSTDRKIRRRVDIPAGQFIDDLATEDQFEFWSEDGTLFYQPSNEAPDLSISESDPVADVSDRRNFEDIRNIVTVQGAGDIEVAVRDQASIAFYGPQPRSETIVKRDLQTEAEAQAHAEGYLDDHARDDGSVTFSMLDTSYRELEPEDQIQVTWPRTNIDGTVTVKSVTDRTPLVDVTVEVSSA